MKAFLNYVQQVAMALDRLANAALFGGLADETISARLYRMYIKEAYAGKLFMKPVNLMFKWQGFNDHCKRAFYKICARVYLPQEYFNITVEDARKFLDSETPNA